MNGFIEYGDTSPFSPVYESPLTIDDKTYSSAEDAIQSGIDEFEVLLSFVRENRDLFLPYKDYTFVGKYSGSLNHAISTLLVPKREPLTIGRYVLFLTEEENQRLQAIPIKYSIPIERNAYTLSETSQENIYRQEKPLDHIETYRLFLFEGMPVYVGAMGSFFGIPSLNTDITQARSKIPRRS